MASQNVRKPVDMIALIKLQIQNYIICGSGDFNDTAYAFVCLYQTLSKAKRCLYWKKIIDTEGLYGQNEYNLEIDYILQQQHFNLQNYQRYSKGNLYWSFPIVIFKGYKLFYMLPTKN
jgi:hypothetical protein